METKTHYKKLRNPNYIGSYELMTGGDPVDMVVTIERAVKEMVQNGDKKEDAMVLYLKDQKPMIVNSTNAKAITAALESPYIEDWSGKSITLYVARIKAFGETVDALRVRKEKPAQQPLGKPEFTTANPQWQQMIDAVTSGTQTAPNIIKAIQKTYSISEPTAKLLIDATPKTV